MKAFRWLTDNVWALEAFDPGKYLLRKYEPREGWLVQVMSVGFEADSMQAAERIAPQFMAVSDGRVVDPAAASSAQSKNTVTVSKQMPAGIISSLLSQLVDADVATVKRLGMRDVRHQLGNPDSNGESELTLMGELASGTSFEDFSDLVQDEFGIDAIIKKA